MTDEEKIYSDEYADVVSLTGDLADNVFGAEDVFVRSIGGRFSIVHVPRTLLAQTGISTRSFEPFVMGLCQSWISDSGIDRVLEQSTLDIDGTGVLIGIIDTGADYLADELLYPDGTTKIAACWDQENRTGPPPRGRIYGTEFTSGDINAAIQSGTPLSFSDRTGHGTRLAKIAVTAAPQAELIIVKLKQAKPYIMRENFFGDSPAFESSDLMEGLDYAAEKAAELGRPLSAMIAVGTTQGAHNGLSLLEQYINGLSLRTGICITAATGNEGLARRHFFTRADEQTHMVEISVENSPGFTLWLWNDYLCRMSVGVVSPIGETIAPIQPVSLSESRFSLPLGSGNVNIQYRLPIGEKQLSVVTLQAPVNGIWRIELSFSRTNLCGVDAWLPFDRLLSGNIAFLDPSTASTAVVPSTAPLVLTAGGYNSNTGGIYENTGRGPNTRGVIKPDITAPAVDVFGTDGTSNAAAVTAGAAALLLQWGIVRGNNPGLTTDVIKTYLTAGAEQPTAGLEAGREGFPNNIWGYGKLNLYNTFRQIL